MTGPTDVERAWEQVRRNPRELAPRRQLADALTKQGDPLGEFLSIVLTPDKERPASGGPRADSLFQRYGDAWFPLPPGEKPSFKRSWTMFVGRGMPDSFGFSRSGPPAADQVAWWAARYPIRHIYIGHTDPTEALCALERQGHLTLAETLELNECTVSDAAVDAIANATPGLRSLQLTKPVGLDSARAERLFHGRGLADLTFLGVAAITLEPPAMRALWSGLPKLDGLRLYNVELGRQSLGLPPGSRRRWTDITLEGSFTAGQALELVRGLDLAVTCSLRLRGGSGNAELMIHLRDAVRAGELRALRELELQNLGINATALAVLLEAPPPNLVHLDVSHNSGIGEEGLKALAAYARRTRALKSLPLDGIHVGSGEWLEATDWDGSGSFPYERNLSVKEIREKFRFDYVPDAAEWLLDAEEHARHAPEELSSLIDDEVRAAIKALDTAVSKLDEVLKLIPEGAARVPETAFRSDAGRELHQKSPELFERKHLEEKRAGWKQRSQLGAQLVEKRVADFRARNAALAQMLLEGLNKPEDPEHQREREEHERRNEELLAVFYVTSKQRPPHARSLKEMELATELEACPSCKRRGLTGVRLHGGGTAWAADATCPGCGAGSTFRYTTKSDPATITAPPYELAPGPSFQIRKEAFREELDRLLPLVDSDPAVLQRALICSHELCKLFYNRLEAKALEAQRAELLAKASKGNA